MQLIIKIIIQQANQSQLFYIKQRKEKQNKTNKQKPKQKYKIDIFYGAIFRVSKGTILAITFFLQKVKASEDPAFLK